MCHNPTKYYRRRGPLRPFFIISFRKCTYPTLLSIALKAAVKSAAA
jgi:hypothetical protein